jgi:hypothetical protein
MEYPTDRREYSIRFAPRCEGNAPDARTDIEFALSEE